MEAHAIIGIIVTVLVIANVSVTLQHEVIILAG